VVQGDSYQEPGKAGGLQKWPGGGLGLSHKVTGKSQTHVTCKPNARRVMYAQLLSHVQLFAAPWTVAHQAPQSTGILQAKILEWVAVPFSRESSQPWDQAWVSCIVGRFFTIRATREA